MIRLYCSEDRFQIWQVKELLESRGIPCFVKNEFAIGAMGDLAPFDCAPEVWLTDDEWQPRAKRLLDDWLSEQRQCTQEWRCAHCQEDNGGGFEICWQCGEERPAETE
ncbi:DUF2007 domain-containing protein [Bowmanella denitrificans]|uniref:putative signal transducing protein n=1 Tax=Bowmanella denitrificans TaxID=366582 RepID=UPI001FED223E|nr:DUF2007 domain-containing protein [Bowmanella denitrificans]